MKKVFFLSHHISGRTPLYAGEKTTQIKSVKAIKNGDTCNKTHCSFSAHAGTHLDMPRHFLEKGRCISDLKPRELIFKRVCLSVVKGVGPGRVIKGEDLCRLKDCEMLLIKTGFEKQRQRQVYWKNSPALDEALAGYIKKACPAIRAVGVDFISITNLNKRELGKAAHNAFLGKGIFLLEDMKLKDLKRAPDLVIASPLLLENAEAAPSTVLAVYN